MDNDFRHVEFVFDNDKGPKWQRTVIYDYDEDDIFIPAIFIMPEMVALLALGYDGVKAIRNNEHLYVPLKWAEEQTNDKRIINKFEWLDEKIRSGLKPWEYYCDDD